MDRPDPDLLELRRELDRLDEELLKTAARRDEIVTRIGRLKREAGRAPLFDRDRERAVLERAEQRGRDLGLPAGAARQLLSVLIESSHDRQSLELDPDASTPPLKLVIVGGAGNMGRRLSDAFTTRGHAVDAWDLGEHRDPSAVIGAADVVLVSVPMDRVVPVIADTAPLLRPDALLCDINSLKSDACKALAHTNAGEAVGLHPMFGPTVASLRRQKVVVCPVRPGPRTAQLLSELSAMGCELIESEPDTHDRMMAIVQVLVHYATLVMGETLRDSGVPIEDSLRYTSPIYRLELAFIGRLFAQAAPLYAEIEMTNPHGAEVRRRFVEAATTIGAIIDAGDRGRFERGFAKVSDYFKDFADESLRLSDDVIDYLVRQP